MKKIIAAFSFFALLAGLASAGPASTDGKNVLPLGSPLPEFNLTDVSTGKPVAAGDFKDKITTVIVMCRHCPFVQHVKKGIAQLANDYSGKGVAFIGVSSNDVSVYPDDAPEKLKEMAQEEGYAFPVVYDESQELAKNLTAVATPDFYVFGKDGKLAYRGRMDAARPGNEAAVTGEDLRAALDAVLAGQAAPADQKPATGCSIKWKKGSEPAYWP